MIVGTLSHASTGGFSNWHAGIIRFSIGSTSSDFLLGAGKAAGGKRKADDEGGAAPKGRGRAKK